MNGNIAALPRQVLRKDAPNEHSEPAGASHAMVQEDHSEQARVDSGFFEKAESASKQRIRRRQPETCPGDSGTLLSPARVAILIGVTVQTLRTMRSHRRGPDYVKNGARVWYYSDVVDEWRRENFRFIDL